MIYQKTCIYLLLLLILNPVYSFSEDRIFNANKTAVLINKKGTLLKSDDTNYQDLLKAFVRSCKRFLSLDKDTKIFRQFSNKITVADISNTCSVAYNVVGRNDKYIKFFFDNYFTPYLVVDNKTSNSRGTFTGYYLPKIKIKKDKDDNFKYPIYSRPNNIEDDVSYYTREGINKGVLNNKNLELFYTDNLVDLFFLQVQGSGLGEDIDSGEVVKLGFNGKNNHKYTSIGKVLFEKDLLTEDQLNSMDIKKYLKSIDISRAEKLMNYNKSYVFFKVIKDNKIIGSQGVELVKDTSLAVDTDFIPLGFPILLNTELTLKDKKRVQFNKIMVTHDTGSAIKGVVRGDIFFGDGENAEEIASYQHSVGQYYILIPIDMEYKLVNGN